MGRSQKDGLQFFSFDTDFFEDKTIKVLKARYGADGITVYLYILCLVYKNGYFYEADDDFIDIAESDLNMSQEKIGQIINFLCGRSLLSDTLLTSDKVLTSHGIQIRYQQAMKARKLGRDVEVEEKYWVLDEQETEPFIKFTKNPNFSVENQYNSERKNDKSVEKMHIEENRGDKNRKYNNSLNTNEQSCDCTTVSQEFEFLWKMYPRKLGKKEAFKSYQRVRKKGVPFETVKEGLESYLTYIEKDETPLEYIKHGSTWFSSEGWNDDYSFKVRNNMKNKFTEYAKEYFSEQDEKAIARVRAYGKET